MSLFSLDSGLLNQASVSHENAATKGKHQLDPQSAHGKALSQKGGCKRTVSFWELERARETRTQKVLFATVFFFTPDFWAGKGEIGHHTQEERGALGSGEHASSTHNNHPHKRGGPHTRKQHNKAHNSLANWVHYCCQLRGGDVRQRVWSDATV